MSDIINDHETKGEWEIQLTMLINFFSSKDSQKISTVHTKSDNTETIIGGETDKIIEELSEALLERYQKGLEKSMQGSEFLFDGVDSLYYK